MSPPTHPTILIRTETPADHAAVRRVLSTSFDSQPVVATLVEALRTTSAWRPALALVAVVDQAVVGFVTATRGWVDDPAALADVLVVSPLAVDPAHQRRGVGAALMQANLAAAAATGAPAIFLEGDPAYYRRFGFTRASNLGFDAPSARIPAPAFQVIIPGSRPTITGRLVYPDPFWVFDCIGLRQVHPRHG